MFFSKDLVFDIVTARKNLFAVWVLMVSIFSTMTMYQGIVYGLLIWRVLRDNDEHENISSRDRILYELNIER